MSYQDIKEKELKRNHDMFTRLSTNDNEHDKMLKQRLSKERQRLNLPSSQVRYPRDLIRAKNPSYVWLRLLYSKNESVVPNSIGQYFNYSNDRTDYEMNGDAELEIYLIPKTDIPTFSDLVKLFTTEYFLYPLTPSKNVFNILDCGAFKLSEDQEIVMDVSSFYCNSFVMFRSFEHLLDSAIPNVNYEPDFIPGSKGYKQTSEGRDLPHKKSNNNRQIRLRCIFDACGNEYEALYETDDAFIFLSAGTS